MTREQMSQALAAQGYELVEDPQADSVVQVPAEAEAPPLQVVQQTYRGADLDTDTLPAVTPSLFTTRSANGVATPFRSIEELGNTAADTVTGDPVSAIVKVSKRNESGSLDVEPPAREVILTESGQILGHRG